MKKACIIALFLFLLPCIVLAADYSTNVSNMPETGELVSDIGDALVQKRYDWDGGGLILYKGIAAAGDLSNSGTWRIFKYSYDDSDSSTNPSIVQVSEGAWTNRTSLTYK